MSALLRPLRISLRSLARSPGLSLVSIVTLALGIGLCATMFSVAYGALVRGLPFEEADEIVALSRTIPERGIERVPYRDYLEWRERQTAFEDLATYQETNRNLSDGEQAPDRVPIAVVSPSLFPVLGVEPVLGRLIREDEGGPGGTAVALIGHGLWTRRYGQDRRILGRTLRLNGEPHTVVGVLPPDFAFPSTAELWVPILWSPAEIEWGANRLPVVGRLRDGVDLDRARGDLDRIVAALAREQPETNAGSIGRVRPFVREFFGEEEIALIYTMLAAGALILLVACANVANLLLARGVDRSRDVAVRSALGARRGRLVGGVLGEALLLALLGGALGVGLAHVGVDWFNAAIATAGMPFWIVITVDLPILLFILGCAVLSAFAAGILPAIRATGGDVAEILQDESRGSSGVRVGRATRTMVVTALALSFPLLVAAGLMIRSVGNLHSQDLAFEPGPVLAGGMFLDAEYPEPEDRRRFYETLVERLAAHPGIEAAAVGDHIPRLWSGWRALEVEGVTYARDEDRPSTRVAQVSPGYFDVLRVEPVAGRVFEAGDRLGGEMVVVVNESFVRTHFPGQDALGRQVRLPTTFVGGDVWRRIVGIVPDLYMSGPEDDYPDGLYVPVDQSAPGWIRVLVRGRSEDPLSLVPILRAELAALDPDLPLYSLETLDQTFRRVTWFYRLFGGVFSIFGAVALFLAAVGLYGVMAFSVARQTREMGVRMAFGAGGRDLLRLVVRRGMIQVALGMAIGLVLAFFGSRFLGIVLFDVDPRDPVAFLAVAAVLAAAGFLASVVPGARAARLDPSDALRHD